MMKPVTPRSLTLSLLLDVDRKKQPLDALLPELYGSALSPEDKAFARRLLMATLRHHGQLAAIITPYLNTPLNEKYVAVDWLLRMGAAQLLLLETPPHAAIDTSVHLCKALGFVHQAGMVNAVLRKLATDAPKLPPETYNLPSWLKGAWRKSYGRDICDAIALQATCEPPLDLSLLQGAELEGQEILPLTLRREACDLSKLEGYSDGNFWAQDAAATLPVRALGDVAGKRVVDLCAAPGGKTLQLCAGGATVIAVDRSHARFARLHENLQRMKMHAQIVTADASQWQPEGSVDAVLLDAPCSATGTVRRHPDLLLRKMAKDVHEMVQLQRKILISTLSWLPPKVPLVYAVCSLQPEEGEGQIEWLLSEYPQCSLMPFEVEKVPANWYPRPGMLRTLPHYWSERGGMDGFFIAKLQRSE